MVTIWKVNSKGKLYSMKAVILEEQIHHKGVFGKIYIDGILFWIPTSNKFIFGFYNGYRGCYMAYADDSANTVYWEVEDA